MAALDDGAIDHRQTIAALRRKLHQRTAERDEALAQQAATSEILNVISRSPTDIRPVFEAIVARAARLCEAEFSVVARLEDGLLHLVAVHSMSPEETAAFHSLFPRAPGRHFVMGRAFVEAQPVHIEDVLAESDYDSRTLEVLQSVAKYRSFLGVPIFCEGRPIGVIGCGRREVRPFTAAQIELVKTFADQAAIAIENVRLFVALAARNRDLGEALEQQTATAEILQVINSSPGDLGPVFESILDKAHVLCGATLGTLFLYDGEKNRAAATHGYPEDLADELRRGVGIFPNSGPAALLAGARLVHRPDITQVGDPVARAVSQRGGVRTNLLVPLRKDGAFLGMISCNRKEVRPYTDKEVALIENFAAQAVIAIENARLLGELRERTGELAARNSEYGERIEHQSATIDVLKVMSASPGDPQPVFELIVRRARDLCNTTQAGLFEFDGELVHRRSGVGREAYGKPEAVEAYDRLFPMVPTRGSITCRAILDRQTIHVRDMATAPGVSAAVRNLGYKSQIALPLLRDGAAIGAMQLTSAEIGGFTDSQVALLQTFAEQAVIAITSAETYRELQQRTGDLQESLEYQTATSDVLKVISRSTADVQPVLDTVAATAVRLCGADLAGITMREGEVYRFVSGSAVDPEHWAALRQRTVLPGRDSVAARVALEGGVVHVADISADPDFALPEGVTAGLRTTLGVPLLREGAVLGTINVNRKRVEPFTERQIELLRTFADQAVIAIENARLLGELQARTRELEESLEYQTATSDVLKVISRSTADVQPVLDTVVETAARLCVADAATMLMREGGVYRYVAASEVDAEYWALLRQRTVVPGRGGVARRVALEGRVVHIADILADPDYAGSEAAKAGRRTQLGVPLLRDSEPIGIIMLSRKRVEPFTERQIELIRTFADQAVIAIENARLLGELQARTRDLEESLEYQTAISDVLNVISRSTGDVQPVLDTVAETATRLCGADNGSIRIREGEVYRHVSMSTSAAEPEFLAQLRQRAIVPGRDSVIGRAALEGRVMHVADILADPEFARPEVVAAGRRTVLGVPLLREGAVIGTIGLTRQRVKPFTERQIELVRTFADQAVIAIENARLLGELQARTDELTRSVAELQALEEVLRAVNSSLDLDTVLATIISRAAQLSQADEGTIYEFDEAEEVFVPKSAFGMSAERVEGLRERRVRLGETHLGRAAVERAPVHVEDVQQDPTNPDIGALLEGIHAVLAVPLLREDKVVGGLVIRRRTVGGFAPTIPTLLQTFAGQAVLAIENARLFQELAARGEEARRAHAAAEAALADLRRAQDRLIQAEKMASLGQLTAGIAHEIKNPLNFVNNFAGLSVELLDELKETAAPAIAGLAEDERADIDEIVGMLTGNLEKIAEHGRRADGIVKSMLEHSRGGTGERREVDLNGLVEEALNLAYHGARAQDQNFNITLERDLGPAIAAVELVPQEITRVLLNLIGNGFYAATKRRHDGAEPDFRPTLKVATRDCGAAVEIRIRDNGAGIPPEIRDKLFQPFFTTKPTGEGTGLGLSISWDIVTQQHGGTIEVDSRVGEFTEFTIRLPRTDQRAPRRSETRAPGSATPLSG